MGRRRIKMEMVKDIDSRQVTFSKRRTGLFKKANELATLCAAQVCIIVFSPGGKPFSYGQPSVDAVAGRFMNKDPSDRTFSIICDMRAKQAQRYSTEKLSQQLEEIDKKLQEARKRGEMLDNLRQETIKTNMFAKSVDQLTLPEALKEREAMMELQRKVIMQMNEMEASSSLLLLANSAPKDDAGGVDIKKN